MPWICKKCGVGEIVAINTRRYSNTHKILKNGNIGKIIYKDKIGETMATNYICEKCDTYFNDGIYTKLEDVADWEK
ncbi:MAG: hypothetical protein ACRDA0_06490 [Cetobacterium sp.]|uniref:hypothetical protein n=1 Tax=Cetobacterium sp. TaxID=2071632 RepID=UPI003F361030